MQTFRFVLTCACICVSGCSLVFDGSRFTGQSSNVDGSAENDGGTSHDADTPSDGARDDDADTPVDGSVTPSCAEAACPSGQYCIEGSCKPCDEDGDGYFRGGVDECDDGVGPADCNDSNPSIYPYAVPVCGNGIDESCGTEAPGLPVTEFGFLAIQEVSVPSGMQLERLRVFARNNDQALVFVQIDDGRRTPLFAEVPLTNSPGGVIPNESISARVYPDLGHAQLAYDAIRGSDDTIHFALFMTNGDAGGTKVSSRLTVFPRVGGFSNLVQWDYPETLTWQMQVAGAPALVHEGSQFVLGIPMRVQEAGVSMPRIVVFSMSTNEVVTSGGMANDSMPGGGWSVSDGTTAVFPGAGNSFLVWRGGRGFDQVSTFFSTESALGRVGVGTRYVGGVPRHTLIIPSASAVRVASTTCPSGTAFATCTFDPATSSFPPSYGPGDPLLTTFMSEEGSFNFVHVTRGDGALVDGLVFGHHTIGAGTSEMMPLPTDETTGMIHELNIDGFLERQPGASTERGIASLTYSWARRSPSGTRLFVGGIRACVGYPTD